MSDQVIESIIRQALAEDTGRGDVTTRLLVPSASACVAAIVIRETATVCGLEVVERVFRKLDKQLRFQFLNRDGDRVKAGSKVAMVTGKSRAILTGERVALNFLSHLSGIATTTRSFVDRVKPFHTAILDTRKTTPNLRFLERMAVECGGGVNHRYDLSQMVLVKDNHRFLALKDQNFQQMVSSLRSKTDKLIEVEVDSLTEFKEAVLASPDFILLDNFTPAEVLKAVRLRDQLGRKKPLLEVSGGINLNNVHRYAGTGVERISIGALTHSPKAVDVSLEIIS